MALGRHAFRRKWAPTSPTAGRIRPTRSRILSGIAGFLAKGELPGGQPRADGLHLLGFLATMIKVSAHAGRKGLPLRDADILSASAGQVSSAGADATRIIHDLGVTRYRTTEAGRTSRATVGYARDYLAFLNDFAAQEGPLDLSVALAFWVRAVRDLLRREPIEVKTSARLSHARAIAALVAAARERERTLAGVNVLGTVMQHCVGAVLEAQGVGAVHNHANKADAPSGRGGDFDFADSAWHVTAAPSEKLIEKCARNVQDGLKPVIVTLNGKRPAATALAENRGVDDRVDVLGFEDLLVGYLAAERARCAARGDELRELIARYNAIVDTVEHDASLKIRIA